MKELGGKHRRKVLISMMTKLEEAHYNMFSSDGLRARVPFKWGGSIEGGYEDYSSLVRVCLNFEKPKQFCRQHILLLACLCIIAAL